MLQQEGAGVNGKRQRLYLEDVEGFELDVPAVVSQQVHHQLQVVRFADVLRHDGEVVPVQEKFPEELETGRQTDRQVASPDRVVLFL